MATNDWSFYLYFIDNFNSIKWNNHLLLLQNEANFHWRSKFTERIEEKTSDFVLFNNSYSFIQINHKQLLYCINFYFSIFCESLLHLVLCCFYWWISPGVPRKPPDIPPIVPAPIPGWAIGAANAAAMMRRSTQITNFIFNWLNISTIWFRVRMLQFC